MFIIFTVLPRTEGRPGRLVGRVHLVLPGWYQCPLPEMLPDLLQFSPSFLLELSSV